MPGPWGIALGLWAYALTQLAADRPVVLLAGAALGVAALLAAVLAARALLLGAAPGVAHRAAGLRARARDRRVPRNVDPDAPGRPRPRAPGVRLSAA